MRTSAFSAAHFAVGGTQSSCSSEASSKKAAWRLVGRELDDREAAGAQHLLVDRLHQRLGGGRRLDHADVALLHARWSSWTRIWASASARWSLMRRRLRRGRERQPAVHAAVVGQLGVEGHGQDVALPHRHRMAVDLGQHLHVRRRAARSRGPDEHRRGSVARARRRRGRPRSSGPGGRRRCAARSTSSRPRWSRSSMISPAQVPSTGLPARGRSRAAARPAPRARSRASSWCSRRRGSRARRGPRAPRAAHGRAAPHPGRSSTLACASKSPWRARTPTTSAAGRALQPRLQPSAAARRSASSVPISSPAWARPARARPRPPARDPRSAWSPRRSRAPGAPGSET